MSLVESALLLMLMLLLLPSTGSPAKMPGEQSNAIAAVHPFLNSFNRGRAFFGICILPNRGCCGGMCWSRFPHPPTCGTTSAPAVPTNQKQLSHFSGSMALQDKARERIKDSFTHLIHEASEFALRCRDVIVVWKFWRKKQLPSGNPTLFFWKTRGLV